MRPHMPFADWTSATWKIQRESLTFKSMRDRCMLWRQFAEDVWPTSEQSQVK